MRLIDADALLEAVKATDRYFMVKFDIERAPTVDPWHYPSKGEYPTDEGQYWVMRYDDVSKTLFPDILWFEKNTWWNRLHTGDYAVRAWQYIVPPKEEA